MAFTNEAIQQSPSFEEVCYRFEKWIVDVMNRTIKYNEPDSDDNDTGLPILLESPCVVLAAHNGTKFDFPLLLCQLLRHQIPTTSFKHWYFLDTLHVFKDLNHHSCIKLQCLARDTHTDPGNAHRALDDCIALCSVSHVFANRLGTSMKRLFSFYLVELDLESSIAQLTTLM